MAGMVDIEAGRAAVCAATASLSGLSGSVFAVADTELGPFFREVDDLSRQVDAARVAILAEALTRGARPVQVPECGVLGDPRGPVLPGRWGLAAGQRGPGRERELGGAQHRPGRRGPGGPGGGA